MLQQSTSNGNFNNFGELLTNDTENYLDMSADYSVLQTNTTLITGVVSRVIEIHYITYSSSANTGTITFTEETTGALICKFYLSSQSNGASGILHKELTSGKGLLITCPANTFVNVIYHLN